MKEINVRANYFMADPQNWDDNPILVEVVLEDEKKKENLYCYVEWTLDGGMDFRAFKVPMFDLMSASSSNESIKEAFGMLAYNFEIDKDAEPSLYKLLYKQSEKIALPILTDIAKKNDLITEDDEIETLL